MTEVTRRALVGGAAAGVVGLAGQARAAEPAASSAQQPPALFGATKGEKVSLPPLHNDTEVQGPPPEGQPPARRLGVAVVGLGHLSLEQIIPGFAESRSVRLAALVSGERDKARAIAAQHGLDEKNLYDYAGFDRLKDNPDVDIVYIVLPNSMHAEFTQRAAQAGKHVLCEKPMATSVADAQRMVDSCREAKRSLMIAYRLQYDPVHRQLIAMTRAQEFGPVRVIQAANGQNDAANGQWRQIRAMAGGGSLPDVGLYCLSAFRYLTGEEPVEVTGQITQPKDDARFREVEDVCAFTLRFPSGILATGLSNYSAHENRALRVMAADAWYGADPAFGYDNLMLQVGRKQGRSNVLEQRRLAPHNQFATEMDAFAEAIRAGREPHTPGEEGLADMRLIEAIYQAAAGGNVVRLPRVEGLDTTRGPPPAQEG